MTDWMARLKHRHSSEAAEKEPTPKGQAWTEAEEERAAIIQHEAGAPRAWAEGFARLDRAVPPQDVSPQRWQRFIDDCGLFIDFGWAARADALGWGPLDLFGCDRARPWQRVERLGLLWLLNGRRLLKLDECTAAIQAANGATLTFYRLASTDGRALAWDLRASQVAGK
jgi:hypothetical protein